MLTYLRLTIGPGGCGTDCSLCYRSRGIGAGTLWGVKMGIAALPVGLYITKGTTQTIAVDTSRCARRDLHYYDSKRTP